MIEKLIGLERMSILQCEALAKDIGFDSATFDLCGPNGRMKAKWLDAYMGIFQIDGQEGFIMTSQVQFAQNLWCENLMPANNRIRNKRSRRNRRTIR